MMKRPQIDYVEQRKPSKRFNSSQPMNPRNSNPGSTPSSPPTIEPFHPLPIDFMGSSPSMDTIESIRKMYENIDPVRQIDPLVSFLQIQLHKMNASQEAESISSEGCLEIVKDGTKLASKTIETISSEAEKLPKWDAVKGMGKLSLDVIKGIAESHWVFIGLSVAAFVAESCTSIKITHNDCRELLLKILELAKCVKQYSEQMPERGKMCNAVCTIVEGAVICCNYIKRGKFSRFWSPMTAAAQLEKTNQQLGKDYGGGKDVFLSHSGKQKNFVRQLHRDLTTKHVSCFFDEDHKSLPLAEKFPPLIFKAAETCKIAVLILSKEFIRSKWPMLELSAFISAMNSGKNANLKLLPIFFMISPIELSHITKNSPEWQKLEVSNDTRDKWQDALKIVRSINGLHFGEGEDEVAFRDKLVKSIDCLLQGIIRRPQLLDFQPVGIEEQVLEVKALMDMEGPHSALAVIVCGLGGIGKSTLAASVVQTLDWSFTDFKFCRVEIDEKTPDKTSHIIKLQQGIISDLGGDNLDVRNTLDGRHKVKQALKNQCCLLFVDNVVDKNYVRDLLPKDLSYNHQKTKLRIIITSREKNVKAELNPHIMCREYEVKGLSDATSKSLLLETILHSQVVKETDFDEECMINEVAIACKGVPLLLSVFGKHLGVERNKNSYQEALDVLREGNLDSYRDEDLGTKLMFVYDKIKDVEVKEAFLDICTYFHGWEWNLVVDIVDFPKLEDLFMRTLVSKSSSGKVIVHDILRLMGIKEARLTRFSNYKDLSDALEDNLDGFGNVKGISLVNTSCNSSIRVQSTFLEAMHKSLRVLMLGDSVTFDGPPCQKTFRNLRYLGLGDINAFPFKDPSKLHKLRAFFNTSKHGMNLSHLPSSLKCISHEVADVDCDEFAELSFQNLSSLKSLILKTWKSVKLPEELYLPVSLVDLNLKGCKNLPKDIGHLTSLESLILDRSDLKCLPHGFCKLKNLKHLSMNYCSNLAFLSELDNASSLEVLSMEGCENLRALPKSLGGLLSLQEMKLRGSINLQLLPESLGDLRIQKLELLSLVNLHALPNSFGNMPFLKILILGSCHSLTTLPDSFVQLKMLETLHIIKCTKLSILPENFGLLRYLKNMTVERCHLLKELPYGFGALPALKTFELRCCKSFMNLSRDFTDLTSLEVLIVESLPFLSRIPDGFGKLKTLRFLFFANCFQLKTLSDDFENLAALERLTIRNCPELDGAIMEKIVKLQHCYVADIDDSRKLLQKWRQMQPEIDHLIAILGDFREEKENRGRAIRVALLNGKCVELNNTTNQLMERSSLLVGLEEGVMATVALIMLPIQMQSHQHQTLQRFVEMAKEAVKANGSDILQIVCAKKFVWTNEMTTATKIEERAEEGVHQILLSLPKGSCAIPSCECKRVKILTYCCARDRSEDKLSFFMANVVVDSEGRKSLENLRFSWS